MADGMTVDERHVLEAAAAFIRRVDRAQRRLERASHRRCDTFRTALRAAQAEAALLRFAVHTQQNAQSRADVVAHRG